MGFSGALCPFLGSTPINLLINPYHYVSKVIISAQMKPTIVAATGSIGRQLSYPDK